MRHDRHIKRDQTAERALFTAARPAAPLAVIIYRADKINPREECRRARDSTLLLRFFLYLFAFLCLSLPLSFSFSHARQVQGKFTRFDV